MSHADVPPEQELERGSTIGRYMVLGLLGKGGMGEVYAAYDPELDRKVAIKLLRSESHAGMDGAEARARLLREAQAIAKLSHPNVLVVYDVGTYAERVFLSMEFIDGSTLGFWREAQVRKWREIVACFMAAGRGLAAAHKAGLVHRDFKPDNVMVARDGQIRVMDFGLARLIGPSGGGAGAGEGAAVSGGGGVPPAGGPGQPADLAGLEAAGAAMTKSDEARRGVSGSGASGSGAYGSGASGSGKRAGTRPGDGASLTGIPPSPRPASLVAQFTPTNPSDVLRRSPGLSNPGLVLWSEDETATRNLSAAVTGAAGLAMGGAAGGDPLGRMSPVSPLLVSALTQDGAMIGTPAYMAPEQFQGAVADDRSDQFSFCIALYEALYNQRPFAGRNLTELTANVINGRIRDAPAKTAVPTWIRRVLLRGLRVDRAERYASMDALLAALAHDPAKARTRWLTAGAAVVAVAAAGIGVRQSVMRNRQMCAGAGAKLAAAWSVPRPGAPPDPRKDAIRKAFLATGKRYAADAYAAVSSALDRYAAAWSDMYRESCEATHMRGEQSAEVLDLRMSCLGDRLNEARALTNVFSDANGDVVSKSAQAVQSLRPIEQCADIAALKAVVKPPDDPAVKRAVADVREKLAEVKALASAGRYKAALERIPEVTAAARKTGYQPVVAEALVRGGELQDLAGEPLRAEANYEEAVWIAEETRYDEVVAEAAAQLASIVGYAQGRHAEGKRWNRLGQAALRRLGPGHELLAAWQANNLAAVLLGEGKYQEALTSLLEAARLKKAAVGEQHFDSAISIGNAALALFRLGRVEQAIEKNRQALEILRRTLGPDHPRLADYLSNAAEYLNARGQYAEAQDAAEKAVVIWERELNPQHPLLAAPLTSIGWSWVKRANPTQALPVLERALTLVAGAESPGQLADIRFALASALEQRDPGGDRSQSLARQARRDYVKAGALEERIAEIDRWFKETEPTSRRVTLR